MSRTSKSMTGTARSAAPSATACSNCGAAQALSIEVSDGRGGPRLTMTSCPRCEHRAWTHASGTVVTGDVLRVLSGRADFTLVPAPGGRRIHKG